MPKYAGFWSRALSIVVDSIIFLILGLLFSVAASYISYYLAIVVEVFLLILFSSYEILMVGIYGQTIGKWVAGIKVIPINDTEITIRHGLLRYSVDLTTSTFMTISTITAMLAIDPLAFNDSGFWDQQALIVHHTPKWYVIIKNISLAWAISELLVLLFNKKKRALHDFIAGTVVIHVRRKI